MEEAQKVNLAVSSWPGCGGTSLTLILAVLFDRKYLAMGKVYRVLGQKLGFPDEGQARPRFDNYVEKIIGATTDNYIDHKLLYDDNLIVESDVAAFRIGKHPKVFSIFLKADKSERLKRVSLEGRDQAEFVLETRDQLLAKVYEDLWQIDFFNEELISKKYNLLFDNSNMGMETEVKLILDQLKTYNIFSTLPQTYWDEIYAKVPALTEDFVETGKEKLLNELKNKNLLIKPEDIMQDITKAFPEDVQNYPENIRNIFLGLT